MKFLGNELRGKFFYLQFGSRYDHLHHAHAIMHSRIWFELSDQGATPPHVTRKVALNTRPSFLHMQGSLGTRLVLLMLRNSVSPYQGQILMASSNVWWVHVVHSEHSHISYVSLAKPPSNNLWKSIKQNFHKIYCYSLFQGSHSYAAKSNAGVLWLVAMGTLSQDYGIYIYT